MGRVWELVSLDIPNGGGGVNTRRGADAASILCVAGVAALLALPMLLYGPLLEGHDTAQHLHLTHYFTEQFWNGDLYPRWLVDINHGLGSPTYFVFPPLPAFVCAVLQPVAHIFHFQAYNIAAFLALFASGICAYVLLRSMTGAVESAFGAIVYMAMPYHLMIDFYLRSAISECWAMAWIPLVIYFVPGTVAGRRRSMVGLAISYALLIFSHLISVVMFSPIPLAFALVLSPAGARIRALVRVAAGMALGVGLSSIYLFPALASGRYVSAARFISQWERSTGANGVLSFGRGLISHPGSARNWFLQMISWSDLSAIALAVFCGFALWRLPHPGPSRSTRRLTLFWSLVAAYAVLMMSRLSTPLWRHFHRLHQTIQHPWRFSTVLCAAVLMLVGVLFSERPWHSLSSNVGFRVIVSLIFVFWIAGYGYVWRRYRVEVPPLPNPRSQVLDNDMLFWAWSPPGMDTDVELRAALLASAGPKARFSEGNGTAEIRLWKPRQIEVATNSFTGGRLLVTQFYYPAWKAQLSDSATPVEVSPSQPEGLLELRVPPGDQRVRIEMPVSGAEKVGRWLGLLSFIVCLVMGLSQRRE